MLKRDITRTVLLKITLLLALWWVCFSEKHPLAPTQQHWFTSPTSTSQTGKTL